MSTTGRDSEAVIPARAVLTAGVCRPAGPGPRGRTLQPAARGVAAAYGTIPSQPGAAPPGAKPPGTGGYR